MTDGHDFSSWVAAAGAVVLAVYGMRWWRRERRAREKVTACLRQAVEGEALPALQLVVDGLGLGDGVHCLGALCGVLELPPAQRRFHQSFAATAAALGNVRCLSVSVSGDEAAIALEGDAEHFLHAVNNAVLLKHLAFLVFAAAPTIDSCVVTCWTRERHCAFSARAPRRHICVKDPMTVSHVDLLRLADARLPGPDRQPVTPHSDLPERPTGP